MIVSTIKRLSDDINAVHGGPKCIPTIIVILVATQGH